MNRSLIMEALWRESMMTMSVMVSMLRHPLMNMHLVLTTFSLVRVRIFAISELSHY